MPRTPGNAASINFTVTQHSMASQNVWAWYTIEGAALKTVDTERDLRVLMDELPKFREQTATAVGKANIILDLIKHNFVHIDSRAFPLPYKTVVRPHLKYCNQVWGLGPIQRGRREPGGTGPKSNDGLRALSLSFGICLTRND